MDNGNKSILYKIHPFMKPARCADFFPVRILKPAFLALFFWFAMAGAGQAASISAEQFAALRSGEMSRLEAALERGLDPKARDTRGNTPLIHAARYGDARCVRLLIERGAEVNATNAMGASALMGGASDYEKVKLLLKNGADPNIRSALGNTALMLAARPADSHRTVELLLKAGANPKATNEFGANALMAAAAGGDEQSVQLLLSRGVDPNAQPGFNHGAFIFGGGRSALMWAAFRGDVKIMKLLMDAGADVNGEGMLGTPLAQAAWADQVAAARLLLERGAKVDAAGHGDGFTPLHWAASTEQNGAELVELLLSKGADPNRGGGGPVDAFMDVPQTPLMLASRRGQTATLQALVSAGATNQTPDRIRTVMPPKRQVPARLDRATLDAAISAAIAPLQETSIESKKAYLNHGSRQDCNSCHQQFLPMAALGSVKDRGIKIDRQAEKELMEMVSKGELKNPEVDWQALFHPDPVFTKGYALFGYGAEGIDPDEYSDSSIHHLMAIQGESGCWYNNLPRPPIQSGDIGATALAVYALRNYGLPGMKAEDAKRIERARRWLWTAKAETTEGRVYQILGLAWSGVPASKLQGLAKALVAEQRADGGWAQLPHLKSDAYATGQALYALGLGAAWKTSDPAVEKGRRYLVGSQLEDGTWYVRRRAFPFQPTMNSGFPHGKDSWISAAATSWAVMALSLEDGSTGLAAKR